MDREATVLHSRRSSAACSKCTASPSACVSTRICSVLRSAAARLAAPRLGLCDGCMMQSLSLELNVFSLCVPHSPVRW